MAYKPGVALGASVTLLLGSIALLGAYVACSAISCAALKYSYVSPLWTGILLLATAFVGIFMSTTKSEKGCGCLFLILSIFGILATIACVGICLVASFWEVGIFIFSPIPSGNGDFLDPINATTTQATPEPTPEPALGFSLWIGMAGLAFVTSIVTCVTSCQYCCCQERVVETVYVYHQGEITPGQNITSENTNTIVAPQHPSQPVFLIRGPPPETQVVQPFPVQQFFPQHIANQQPVVVGYPLPPHTTVVTPPQGPLPSPNAHVQPPQAQLQTGPAAPLISQNPSLHPRQQNAQAALAAGNRSLPRQPAGSNQLRPVATGNSQAGQIYNTRINDAAPAPSVYQSLIGPSVELESSIHHTYGPSVELESSIHHTYGSSARGSNNDGFIDPDVQPATTGNSNIQHTFQQTPARPTADDCSYLEPNGSGNAQAPVSRDIDNMVYEYIDELSDEYGDTEVDPNARAKPRTEYTNSDIGRRPKARNPKKRKKISK